MSRRSPLRRLLGALALCAVALLNVAVVKSTLMQASMEAASGAADATCRDMPGMAAHDAGASRTAGQDKADHRACEFCAAAAHPPLSTVAAVLPAPTAVSWSPVPVWTVRGPRGPPARRPRARGPPSRLLI